MKRKLVALIAAIAVGGSVSAYAAACSLTPQASAVPAENAKASASASRIPSADSAVQAVLRKTSPSSEKEAGPTAQSTAKASSTGSSSSSRSAVKTSAGSVSKNVSSVPGPAASQKQTCSAGNCTANAACKASSCASGSACPAGNCTGSSSCGTVIRSGNCANGNYSQLANEILKAKSGASCPNSGSSSKAAPSGSTSSQASSSAQTSAPGYSAFQNEVVRLVNAERAKKGLAALSTDSLLMKTATVKSQDMAKNKYFSHTSPTYGSPFDLMKQYGVSYRTAGENIAMGQTTPAQVMDGWMNSEGHRANILNSAYTRIGVGVAQNSAGQYYWTQHFAG